MLNFSKKVDKNLIKIIEKKIVAAYSVEADAKNEQTVKFRALNLKNVKGQMQQRKPRTVAQVPPPRSKQMATDQDWGSVWPGPRSFHPAVVPLPVRQGYVDKGPTPDKFANAELMKIPNFLHLTPPIIKKQCEALKRFCTAWPMGLDTNEKCLSNFPIEVTSSDYCHSSPSIRDPLARIVTARFRVSALDLNARARDKFLRLVGERHNPETDEVTIVADRCPLKKQNYEYAMYLITALYHESWNVEPWEELKSLEDMEYYDWNLNASKQSLEALFEKKTEEIQLGDSYAKAVTDIMNKGENENTIEKYGEIVRQLLAVPQKV